MMRFSTTSSFTIVLLVATLGGLVGTQASSLTLEEQATAQTHITATPFIQPTPTIIVQGGPGFLMLGPADFDPLSIESDPAGGVVVNRLIPLHLPQGVRITQLVAFYQDRSSELRPSLQLHRQNTVLTEIIAEMPFPPVDFASGDALASVKVTAPQSLVDNARYSYYLRLLSPSTGNAATRVSFYQIRVDYAFEQHTPLLQR